MKLEGPTLNERVSEIAVGYSSSVRQLSRLTLHMDPQITERSFFPTDDGSRELPGPPSTLKTWEAEHFFWKAEGFIQGESDGWISSPLGCFSWKTFLPVLL